MKRSRAGGSPVWVPACAGTHRGFVRRGVITGILEGDADAQPRSARRAACAVLAQRPQAAGWGAEQTAKLDLSREDAADDILLNQIVWKSVRGLDAQMPPPVRASFVFAIADDDDEEEEDDD